MKFPPNTGISFASKIKFVSHADFQTRTASETRDWTNPDYIGDPYNQVIIGSKGLTEDIVCCKAGGITNQPARDVAFFHFKPNATNNFDFNAKPMLTEAIDKLRESKTPLNGFLIGGKSKLVTDASRDNGQKLGTKIQQMFDNLKIPFSAFINQRAPGSNTNVFYSSAEDTWYVDCQANDKHPALGLRFIRQDDEQKAPQIQSAEDIKNSFEYIQLSELDQVFIGNREIDKLQLYPGFTRIPGGYRFEYDLQVTTHDSSPFMLIRADTSATNLTLGNNGTDRSTLWVESEDPQAIVSVLENIPRIKQSILFSDIERIQYAGNQKIAGFRKTHQKQGDLYIYEKQLEPESVKGHLSLVV